jgi:hypothetical protein
MNELTSTPHDHSSGAEFTYRIDGNVVFIEALQWAGRPVDKVLEQAFEKSNISIKDQLPNSISVTVTI